MGLLFRLIVAAAWLIYAQLLLRNFDDIVDNINGWQYLGLVLILFAGAPIFLLYEIFEFLLDLILPEGWNED